MQAGMKSEDIVFLKLPKRRMTITSLGNMRPLKIDAGKFINEKVKRQDLKVISQFGRPQRLLYLWTLLPNQICDLLPALIVPFFGRHGRCKQSL